MNPKGRKGRIRKWIIALGVQKLLDKRHYVMVK